MKLSFPDILTISFTLFAIIDVIGAVPMIITLKAQQSAFSPAKTTIFIGVLMILFLFFGEALLNIIGIDVRSFALAGSIIVFILGLELVLGINIFKSEIDGGGSSIVPIGYPLLAGSGTLTTVISLRAVYEEVNIIVAILINLVVVYLVLISTDLIERIVGKSGLAAMKKFLGVVLIAMAIRMFETYMHSKS